MAIIKKNEFKNLDKQVQDFQKDYKIHSHLIDQTFIKQLLEQNDDTYLKISLAKNEAGEIIPILSTAKEQGNFFVGNTDMFVTSGKMCPPACEDTKSFSDLV